MTPDGLGGVASHHEPRAMSHSASLSLSSVTEAAAGADAGGHGHGPSAETSTSAPAPGLDFAVPPAPSAAAALPHHAEANGASTRALRSPPSPDSTLSDVSKATTATTVTSASQDDGHKMTPPQQQQQQQHNGAGLSIPQSASNSQDSAMTTFSDRVSTPTTSDTSAGGMLSGGPVGGALADSDSQESQLHQLSAIAAAQDKMTTDEPAAGARKRMADGEVKPGHGRSGSMSPIKRHSRNTSAISMASTTSTIGELSHELRTRLSYAMVKVNHGWQSHSLDEVESMASQAVSPTSSTSTVHRRHGSSASPRLPLSASAAQVHFAPDPVQRRKSNSPPSLFPSSSGPGLAPPAPIRPSSSMPVAPRSNTRRNSNPRYTPTLLSHASASPRTPAQPPRLNTSQPRPGMADPILYSPHQNVREQDAIETLLFMSSPGNSANLKHSFSPAGSPGPQGARGGGRHALPAGPRKTLPSQRPHLPPKKVGFDKSPGMAPPDSPMDLDSPQSYSPNRGTPRRRTNGGSSHLRGALPLPTGLGSGGGTARQTLRDEDIERMLDGAGVESSDDEEIPLPRGRGVLQA